MLVFDIHQSISSSRVPPFSISSELSDGLLRIQEAWAETAMKPRPHEVNLRIGHISENQEAGRESFARISDMI